MKKSEIRRLVSSKKAQLSIDDVTKLSQQLLHQFSLFDFSSVSTLHLFLPINEKKEPDTFIIIEWLSIHYPNVKVIVPRADFDTSLMTHVVYEGKESLAKNVFNIVEPQNGELHSGDIDMVLIPMLAFDKNGFRVGYGKGFYDRFLQGMKTRKIGLCLFDPVESIDDVNAYDVKMDACVTPTTVYWF